MKNKLDSVLIIDDDEADRYLLKRLIIGCKMTEEIYEAENGQEALEFFANKNLRGQVEDIKKFPPVVVFLDINMPIVGGFDFLEQFSVLKEAEKKLESVVLVMVTSSQSKEDKSRALSFDCVKGFIAKMPKTNEEFKAEINKALQST